VTDVRIRKLDEWIVDSLRRQARAHGQSLEALLRELLRQEAMRPKQALAGELHQMQEELREKYGTFSDSTALIREERDRRG
jgi:plasmid stability protein